MGFRKFRQDKPSDSHYGGLIQGVISVVADNEWHTLQEIAEGIGRPGAEVSVAAALHTLRKRGYLVECDSQRYPGVSRFRVF